MAHSLHRLFFIAVMASLSAPVLAEAPAPAPKAAAKPCARPEYPYLSKRNGEQGRVTLGLLISESGEVAETRVVTSSGYPALDLAASEAMAKCKFTPKIVDGKAVEYTFKMQYVWSLK